MEWQDIVNHLNLERHPEGGYYREIYRCDESLEESALPRRYGGRRNMSTSIYFLLPGGEYSRFHRLRSDEIWHFYSGSPLSVHCIDEEGIYTLHRLGAELAKGLSFQVVIKRNTWFAAEVADRTGYALSGCTVAPGFDFADFELAKRKELAAQYPQHRELIEKLSLE